MASKRVHYEAAMKREVILYADKHGNRAASRHFQVSEVNVRRWRNDRDSIFSCDASSKCFTGPKTGRFPQIDEAVMCFVRENRARGLPVTLQAMQSKAEEVADSLGIPEEIFKGSRGWCEGLMRRTGLSLRQRPSTSRKLPSDYRQKTLDFQRRVSELRSKKNYALSQIGNVEETEVVFDLPSGNEPAATNGNVGNKVSVPEKQRLTVTLCVTADGAKLPLYLILHRKSVPSGETFPSDVIVRAEKSGRMSPELVEDWLHAVWNGRDQSLPNAPNNNHMLIVDERLSERVSLAGGEVAVVPSGMSSRLQPLHAGLIELFKESVRKEQRSRAAADEIPLTASGRAKRAPVSRLVQWVSSAWKMVPESLVRKAFTKCRVTNDVDEAEEPGLDSEKDSEEHSDTDEGTSND